LSTDLPVTAGVVQPTYHGAGPLGIGDAFVAKLNPTGTALVYSTYLGGTGDDWGLGIAVDSSGNAYVCGETNSTDFPITPKAAQTAYGGTDPDNYGDAFVTKLNQDATSLTYSTYLGGKDDDGAAAIAVDKTGHAFVTGYTNSTNFPVTPTAFQVVYGGAGPAGDGDIFVTKLNPKGSALTYSTYVGADEDELGLSIAVDSGGGAWVVGYTTSPDFPTTPKAMQRVYGGSGVDGYGDAYVLRVSPNGSALTFSTFMGSTNDDYASGVAVDSSGAYVVGATSSPLFPVTPGAYKTSCGTDGNCNGTYDAFMLKIKP
jgi:hypothetical protein